MASSDWDIAPPRILKKDEDLQFELGSAMSSSRDNVTVEIVSFGTRRKRRDGSVLRSNHGGAVADRQGATRLTRSSTRKNAHIIHNDRAGASPSGTPRKPKKKVRISDPGPKLQLMDNDVSTGLTPAMLRTSFNESDFGQADSLPRTPTRRGRRVSAPVPGAHGVIDPAFPIEPDSPANVIQFTPLRQILDQRTQRRIRRTGLSDEINAIERERRQARKREKHRLQEKDAELAALKQELELARNANAENQKGASVDEESLLSSRKRIAELEAEVSQLREKISRSVDSKLSREYGDGDTIMIDDSNLNEHSVLISMSPDPRRHNDNDIEFMVPASPSLSSCAGPITAEASTQAAIPDPDQEAEIRALSRDLEAAKQEKRDLFNEWRAHINAESPGNNDTSQLSSPPPDFMKRIIPTLKAATSRASEAVRALEAVRADLSGMGFPGTTVDEIISEMRRRFRSARMELERAIPGETPNASLENGNATLDALVSRVKSLVRDLERERVRSEGSLGRERALRGQFDTCLRRYEAASQRIRELEETIDSSAADMLHARMRIQQLEEEGKEQAIGIERLNTALDKYHDEVKGLEDLITAIESEHLASKSAYEQTISDLQRKVTAEETGRRTAESTAAEREARIRELEEIVEQNRIRVCDLTSQVEALEKERERVTEAMEKKTAEQSELHDREIGSMNVRLSELTTALEGAKSEIEKLRRRNAYLAEQLQLEVEAKNNLVDRLVEAHERASASIREAIKADRLNSKVRQANWKIKSDELESEAMMPGSEPITPVSMNRFVNVEVGRGKNRKRIDSGVGIHMEEELNEDDDDESHACSNSEADLGISESDAANALEV